MANFFASILLIVFYFGFPAFNTATTSPFKSKASPTHINRGLSKSRPVWFVPSSDAPSETEWNIYGQWFNQVASKPAGALIHIKSVRSVEEFWNFLTPSMIDGIERVDISVFRPGFEPDFIKLASHETGYILSYLLVDKYTISGESKPSSSSKFNRNKAKKLPDAELISPEGFLAHYHQFDQIISGAMNNGSESSESIALLASDIMGFTVKRQFNLTLFQVFISGSRVKFDFANSVIREMVIANFPECPETTFTKFIKYNLSNYSSRIAFGPSPKASPSKKSPSRVVTIVSKNEEKEDVKLIEIDEHPEDYRIEPLSIEVDFEEDEESVKDAASTPEIVKDENHNIEEYKTNSDEEYESALSELDEMLNEKFSILISNETRDILIEEDSKNADTSQSALTLESSEFFSSDITSTIPSLIRTASDEEMLFDAIFKAPFGIFNFPPDILHGYFEDVLEHLIKSRGAPSEN